MNNKKVEKLLFEETKSLNIPLSEKILRTPLNVSETNDEETASTQKKFSLKFALSLAFSFVIVLSFTLGITLGLLIKPESALTSYIVNINPEICVVADSKDMVVNASALNDDGELLLAQIATRSGNVDDLNEYFKDSNVELDLFFNDVLEVTFGDFGKEKFNVDGEIEIYAVNNKNSVAKEKVKHAKELFEEDLSKRGENVKVVGSTMKVKEFAEKMGFENQGKDLDKLLSEPKNQEVFAPKEKNEPSGINKPEENPSGIDSGIIGGDGGFGGQTDMDLYWAKIFYGAPNNISTWKEFSVWYANTHYRPEDLNYYKYVYRAPENISTWEEFFDWYYSDNKQRP